MLPVRSLGMVADAKDCVSCSPVHREPEVIGSQATIHPRFVGRLEE